jgi:hypothetical protein
MSTFLLAYLRYLSPFYEAPSIFSSYCKFWCASYQTFSEILDNYLKDTLMLLKNILGELRN